MTRKRFSHNIPAAQSLAYNKQFLSPKEYMCNTAAAHKT